MKRETAPRFAGIGGHHSKRAGTVEWGTPRFIIDETGPYELDPCAPIEQPYPTAAEKFTVLDDGLILPWRSPSGKKKRVWLNPPYEDGVIERWLELMALHDHGTALIFARTETAAFHRHVWERASALLFMRGRINFDVIEPFSVVKTRRSYYCGDRASGNAGAPTVLCAYGLHDADVLASCRIEGHFVPLRIPRAVFVEWAGAAGTWAQEVAAFFEGRDGPVELAELYRHFAAHPKAATNRNVDAKVRQQLQRGPYRRVSPGLWEAAR